MNEYVNHDFKDIQNTYARSRSASNNGSKAISPLLFSNSRSIAIHRDNLKNYHRMNDSE